MASPSLSRTAALLRSRRNEIPFAAALPRLPTRATERPTSEGPRPTANAGARGTSLADDDDDDDDDERLALLHSRRHGFLVRASPSERDADGASPEPGGRRLRAARDVMGAEAAATTTAPLDASGKHVVVSGETGEAVAGTRWTGGNTSPRALLGRTRDASARHLLARASLLLAFRERDFLRCTGCGAPLAPAAGELRLELGCAACGRTYWPRTNPCAIVLVEHAERGEVLLGRGPNWARGRFSCLAGFCEAGESAEACAAREVREEAGVDVDPASVEVAVTQPWPFIREGEAAAQGASLMIACVARAARSSAAPRPDPAELAEARYFSREEVAALLRRQDGPPMSAHNMPVAHWMLRAWLDATP